VSPNREKLLPTLVGAGVGFIIVGGVASILHGSARATYDVDLVYSRNEQNVQRLASVLAPCNPYLRDAPVGLPFVWDAKTIHHGLNFTLTTTVGYIDLLGEVAGGGTYSDLLQHSVDRSFRRLFQMHRSADTDPHQRSGRQTKGSRSDC
jgi:hypothetical protein